METIHITGEIYKEICRQLYNSLERGSLIDEVTIDGITFVVDTAIHESEEMVYTGVEFMGQKECYYETNRAIVASKFYGAFDEDGEEVMTDFDTNRLTF